MTNISIAHPLIGAAEKEAVMRVLDSGYLVQGPEVSAFEAEFAAYHDAKHGVATTNGTTALTVALMANGIGAGDEVIIPSFTFVATATSVLGTGARPVFVDVEDATFCIDPNAIEAAITARTKAIMPVHLYGHPADMDPIKAIADKHGLKVIEDAAQAHGSMYKGRYVGAWGAAAFSFYPSKNMTTGEGGIVITDDDALAERMRMVRNHGMNTRYYHELIGYNFRMTNICGAIGRVQLKNLAEWNAKRIANAAYFSTHLTSVRPPRVMAECRHVFHQYTVLAPEGADRDAMVKQLNDQGIGVRVYYPLPIHKQPVFQELGYGDLALPVTDALTERVFSLPVHPMLSDADLARIVDAVNAL